MVGLGNLGTALANSEGFRTRGFHIEALFDADPRIVGRRVGGCTVQPIGSLPAVAAVAPRAIGVVATPASAAQEVTDALVGIGVTAILNFAPQVLTVPHHVLLRQVDLGTELQVLSFFQLRRQHSQPADGGEAAS